ncbi:MAG: hypothetical protein HUU55_04180 [Myxococcales bacterium]|nr:hypothetical protein [Myxococcales bacterium]
MTTFSIDPTLLNYIVCPETRQILRLVDESLLETLRARQLAQTLKNRGGDLVVGTLVGALIRQDGRVVYPIIDDLPDLVFESGILL